MEKGKTKISYIRKPLARRGKMSLLLAAAATFLGGLGVYRRSGETAQRA